MILCVMDDLIFSIKIQTAAKSIGGIDLFFERAADKVLPRIREKQPSLVILDLNNPRTNPLAIVGSMKQDATLASIPTVGYA